MTKKVFYVALMLLSVQLLAVGILKIIGFAPLYEQLQELHISARFGFAIGVWEVVAVIGLWFKKTRGIALLSLLFLVISAIAVHFGAGVESSKAIPATISLLLICTILYLSNQIAIKRILFQHE
jgi:uncharacterized membrane protein